jgi:hypothetical protein
MPLFPRVDAEPRIPKWLACDGELAAHGIGNRYISFDFSIFHFVSKLQSLAHM